MSAPPILELISSTLFQDPSERTFAQLVHSLGDGQLDDAALALARRLLSAWPEDIERLAPRRLDWASANALSLCTHLNWAMMPCEAAIEALACSPHVHKLTYVNLGSSGISGAHAVKVFSSDHWTSLQVLDLNTNALGDDAIEHLCALKTLRTLTFLGLADNDLTERAARALAQTEHLRSLKGLEVAYNPLDAQGVRVLAQAQWPQLEYLEISCVDMGQGAYDLFQSTTFPALLELNMHDNNIPASALAAPGALDGFSNVCAMDLSGERAPVWGKEGIEALCATRVFGQLTSLSLNERGLTPEQLNMVLHALPDDQLKELWLTDNALGDEGVAHLLECRKLQSLNILKLDKNNITLKGVQMLDDADHGLNALVREFVGQDLKDELGLDAL